MRRSRTLFLIIAAAALLVAAPVAVHAAPVGTVTALQGTADITRGAEAARPVSTGDAVFTGDFIRTMASSRLEVTFIDGSITRVAAGSRLRVTEYLFDPSRRKGTIDLYSGKLQSVVEAATPASTFDVQTPTAVFGVRGTDFFAYFSDGIAGGATRAGEVYVYALNHPDQVRVMGAGMATTITSADDIPAIRPATPAEMQMHMEDTTVGSPLSGTDEIDRQIGALEIRVRTYLGLAGMLSADDGGSSAQAYNEAITRIEAQASQLGNELAAASVDIEQMGPAGCFPAGARVLMKDGTGRPIAHIRPGDMVMTYDIGYDALVPKPVLEVYTFQTNHLYRINGHFVTTGTERMLTRKGWRAVNSLKVGDMVLMDREMKEIKTIEYQAEDLTVYNMQVADTHSFYVLSEDSGGYLVHNCGGGGGGK